MKVLVVNAGSSSIKYHLYQMPQTRVLAGGIVEKIGQQHSRLRYDHNGETYSVEVKAENHEKAMELILNTLLDKKAGVIKDVGEIGAAGHRVVHGGEEFTGSVVIDDKVIASIEKFSNLAPLHNPHNLTGIRSAQQKLPGAKQVACFDTAFHTTIPEVAYLYALPYELYEKERIRRYGFHGISHRFIARRAAALLGKGKYDVNAVTCHLGNGCSVTAVKNGRSVDTSMGFTPLEGLVMGTRSGDFDPAILFYLQEKGYDLEALGTLCNMQSGLLGISGLSNDMRNLQSLADGGNARAKLAIDIFCYRVRKYIGAYIAVLGRVDAIVFSGGIGENSAMVRRQICAGLDAMGIVLDAAENEKTSASSLRDGRDLAEGGVAAEADVAAAQSRVRVFVIPSNEELAIAIDTYELTK
jgi:acetate kinase